MYLAKEMIRIFGFFLQNDGVVLDGGVFGPKILAESSHPFRELLGDPDHKETQAEDMSHEEGMPERIVDLE